MKTYMPLNGLWWSRDSGSANCGMPQSAVLGRPGGGIVRLINHSTYFDFTQHKYSHLTCSDATRRYLKDVLCPVGKDQLYQNSM